MTDCSIRRIGMDRNKCEEFLARTMELNDLPGLAIGVSMGGDRWMGTAGTRDKVTGDPLETGDVFHCASVSKLFTSTAVLKLIDAGLLNYEDRLTDILPDLKLTDERAEDIRIWQMLSHTSGIGDVDDYRWEEALTADTALADYVYSQEVRDLPMLHEAGGGRFDYSNIAYEILGHIVSVKSAEYTKATEGREEHLPYEDFVKRYLMEPAGMKNSTMKTYERIGVKAGEDCPLITEAIRAQNATAGTDPSATPMALPHEKREDRTIVPVKYYPYTRAHGPSSTLTSDLEDLLAWGESHLAGRHLSDDACTHAGYEYATVPNNGEKMGLGWFMREQRGHLLRGHEGTDDGFRASFWICPELEMVTLVLANITRAPVKKINIRLFDLLTDR